MLRTIVPARLEFRDGVPYSAAYGDVYHSADGGPGQARHVFLAGCGLPAAWAGRDSFVVLETGFGTGLNFLATWAAWRDDPARPSRLHFLSVEKHPFQAADLARIHAQWPEFAELSEVLRGNWPMLLPGFHRVALDGGRVQLTLMLGEAAECLHEVEARVDAFYLDGFAPDRNTDLWQPQLFETLAWLANPGATAATYTVAAPVLQGLTQAGFACEKRRGYGRKRHCMSARFAGRSRAEVSAAPRHVAVIGGGVAGAAAARALVDRGVSVTLLERATAPAEGASGNPVAVFRPLISRDDNRATRLTRAAFLHDLRAWAALGECVQWARCGVLHLARDAATAAKQQQALAEIALPADYARWVDLGEARELAHWSVAAPGTFYSAAGWVVPGSLCRAWLDHPGIGLQTNRAVGRLQAVSNGWQILDREGHALAEADAVVLANARDASRLALGQAWPLHTVRGQVTQLPAGSLPEIARVIAREGYVAPGAAGPLVGATYEHPEGYKENDDDTAPRAASDVANLARLEAILPGATQRFVSNEVSGRASLRATLPDRLPLVGAVDGQPGLYVAAGYASRGVVWAGLLGEALADLITGQPLPLEAELMRGIAPARFAGNRKTA
ncbi:bifunctional tRNA (5-methylaminomethyl-2-thiouridine)(34)-methyltransferase MnmD/FAD-dependent 5-carboxymethylaminomethyl-2-thiouridine(34) oxidoreductase MnmC [Thiobacillus denitrificans]|uniref:tRNA 5-methylaminomethyl-2-thiouridine biosynthesis bifunctional protein MnmC n=1 Tax=Thiobacillus denitrificans (strain ATCC 25259 / T1) TaxID=292415 RepID=MNMC_THIDA|nr:bifunctional tRNA (5-methylaminomethyl-2-thiouridine)(34)-methyltransferase MnmD/FAD-dependent 5-carboxymethylaminomethyl-2-thiouridine(34) oxidoreductase MnmC [Thiobacillus denitrificans]Q3SID4.2 RecName: Full=tRNA 5-methylaminomethyl-2-thiouridine biosynthesis bifunctional protein MnmC; Short=tRNA mnm(5)s(2)U biosynthesis bifunctional protein; Includes: RecName: Full=tRNA (mnm(5)s(2)U34)-methyltransferase; Includes: RecName: Full=FAD-dependent cmnm(5)s(2)U34 oxidoreductase [Thiobacillus denit